MKLTKKMPDTKAVLSAVASMAATAMLIRSISNDFIPDEFRTYLSSTINTLTRHFSSQLTIVLEEFQGLIVNQVFEASHRYLGTKVTPSVQRIRVTKAEEEKTLAVSADRGEEIVDVFDGIQVKWILVCTQVQMSSHRQRGNQNGSQSEKRSYELSFHKKDKDKILNSYLPFILQAAKTIKEETRVVKLHTVNGRYWQPNPINLDHPMTFQTLAMDSMLKKQLVDDLNSFSQAKDFYKRIGKAWKRGYLLYGPPGTGKSSLIAAMANHLNYDIYDLDLSDVNFNSDLKPLLLGMSNRSILVVEDIDCSIKLQNRETDEQQPSTNLKSKVTLSGLLNFIDGLLSCCGEERIIVFTTNHKERLDSALLRPGRMDMHIHMSFCNLSAFKQLAYNYLGIYNHKLFERIQQLLEKVDVTPAEVAGELMKSADAEVSLQGLIKFLQKKENLTGQECVKD